MTESIIQPQMFKLPGLTRDVVLFFNLQHFMTFHKRVDGTTIKSFGPAKRFQWQNGHQTLTALGGMIGAPLTILIVEMAMASGAKTIYSYGSAGSTGAETFNIGELVTPENGYDETGICRDYGNSEPFQPIVPYFNVRTCRAISSVNSFFRLTPENVERYRKSGIQLIDMEAAPLNCVINRLGKTFRPLFVVSDRVSTTMEWENGGNSDSFREGFEAGLDLIAEI